MTKEPGKKRRKTFRWIAAITLLALVGLSFTSVYLLKRGVTLDHLDIGPASLSGATIVWEDKLDIHLESLTVTSERSRLHGRPRRPTEPGRQSCRSRPPAGRATGADR